VSSEYEPARGGLSELLRFLVVGSGVVAVDFLTYFGLLWLLPSIGISASKALAFVAGACASFALNRSFVFRSTERAQQQVLPFVLLYGVGLCLNTAVNALALRLGAPKPLAWFIATGTSTVSNFLGMKLIVFRRKAL
jgi:putative flippase GtrA